MQQLLLLGQFVLVAPSAKALLVQLFSASQQLPLVRTVLSPTTHAQGLVPEPNRCCLIPYYYIADIPTIQFIGIGGNAKLCVIVLHPNPVRNEGTSGKTKIVSPFSRTADPQDESHAHTHACSPQVTLACSETHSLPQNMCNSS